MDAKELRLGNLFQYDSKIFKVKEIGNYIISGDRGKGNVDFTLKEIKPIILTEEYILKLGFKHTGGCFYTHLPSLIQMFNVGDQFYNVGFKDTNIGRFYHVHQLQNLYFALTGEELTLKN